MFVFTISPDLFSCLLIFPLFVGVHGHLIPSIHDHNISILLANAAFIVIASTTLSVFAILLCCSRKRDENRLKQQKGKESTEKQQVPAFQPPASPPVDYAARTSAQSQPKTQFKFDSTFVESSQYTPWRPASPRTSESGSNKENTKIRQDEAKKPSGTEIDSRNVGEEESVSYIGRETDMEHRERDKEEFGAGDPDCERSENVAEDELLSYTASIGESETEELSDVDSDSERESEMEEFSDVDSDSERDEQRQPPFQTEFWYNME